MAIEFEKESTKYTWETNSYTFGGFAKTWSEAEISFVTADVLESSAISDGFKKVGSLRFSDVTKLSDEQNNGFDKTFNANLVFFEGLNRNINILHKHNFKVEEINNKDYGWSHQEPVFVLDGLSKLPKMKMAEKIEISDTYWDYIFFLLDVVESIRIKEVKKTSFSRPLTDGFSVGDGIRNHAGVIAKEAFNLADLCDKVAGKLLEDGFSTTDGLTRKPKVVVSDFLTTQDYISKSAVTVLEDDISVSDLCSNVAVYLRDFADEIAIVSNHNNNSVKSFASSFGIVDQENNKIGKVAIEELAITETFRKYLPIIRKFYETISVAEVKNNHYETIKRETTSLTDLIIRACEGVLSDLHIINTPIDFDKFVEMAKTPALYNPFIDFKVGEYEYKDAIVKVKLSTTTQETFPSLVNCTMHVDIPDTDDRGTVEITDATAPTKVYFNKFYYNPPEVIVVLRGGSTADGMVTPNIVSTDLSDSEGKYFEVELLDSYGNRKTGSISWTSKGY